MAEGDSGVASGHPFGAGPGLCERRRHRPPSASVGHRHQRVRGRRVLGEAPSPTGHLRSHLLGSAPLERGPGRGRFEVATGHGTGRSGRGDDGLGGVDPAGCLDDRPPPRAATQVGQQSALDGIVVGDVPTRAQGGQAHDDPGRAEAALARPRRGEGIGPGVPQRGVEPLQGGHLTTGHASSRRDACHPWCPVDPDRATPALALRAATVLGRAATEMLAQHLQERCAVVGDLDDDAVDAQRERGCRPRRGVGQRDGWVS